MNQKYRIGKLLVKDKGNGMMNIKDIKVLKGFNEYLIFAAKLVTGCLLLSVAINGIYIPERLLGGGLNGVSMLMNILFGWDIGTVYIILNVPLFLIGILVLTRRFMLFTLFGIATFSICLYLTSGIQINTQSPLTTILLGGCIYGIGNGFIYSIGSSTGGTDIIGKIINRKFSINIATVGFVMNLIIISISMYFFGVDIAVFTLAAMFVASKMSNFVVDGMNHKRMVIIISGDKSKELATAILKEMGRGVTILKGEGAYTGHIKNVIYCVIGITQVSQLRAIVKNIDKHAFVTVTETAQVFGRGRGFYQIEDDI